MTKRIRKVLLSGTYLSQSGVELQFKIEEGGEEEEERGEYIVFFTNNGHSASLAKLELKTMWVLNGKHFYILKDELDELREKVIGKTGKWSIKDRNDNIVELPGMWLPLKETA
uniref:Uncharacterized protein n=1 Tax=viral metagenome TaxID=1070528 RepID=A0A6C0B287_9ZZZZ